MFQPQKGCITVMSDPMAPLEDVPTTSYLGKKIRKNTVALFSDHLPINFRRGKLTRSYWIPQVLDQRSAGGSMKM